MFDKICNSSINCIKDAPHIMQQEATELFAFVARDSEWISFPGIPCHLPLGYALKGSALKISIMRQMIEHVKNTCDNYNIGVQCEIYDGHFLNLILRGESNQPLTKLQLVKDIFNDCKKLSKAKIILFLIAYGKVPENSIANVVTPRNKLKH